MSKPPFVFNPDENTGRGRSKLRPPPRPSGDSLPHFHCGVSGCGTGNLALEPGVLYVRLCGEDGRLFCSYGCLSRWAIRQELRA